MQQGRADLYALNETLDALDLALKAQVKRMNQQRSDSMMDTRSAETVQAGSTPEALTNGLEKKTMIEVDRITKKFRDVKAVDGVSFAVKQGEIFGFLGPNGAGKTTTIRMLIGLAHPTEGRATISGFDCVTQKEAVHRITGVVFEAPTLYNRLSVKDNLRLFANLYQLPKGRVDEVMTRLALADVQGKRAEQLSKGWRQRVLIARALLHKPQVLFLDEPTSGLDPNSARMLHDLIKELRRDGVTIVLCTHDMYEADELCDRIGFIYKGKLAALDTPQALIAEGLQKELVIEFRDDGKLITRCYPFDAPEAVELIQRLQRTSQLVAINTKQLTLADVFARLTGGELS